MLLVCWRKKRIEYGALPNPQRRAEMAYRPGNEPSGGGVARSAAAAPAEHGCADDRSHNDTTSSVRTSNANNEQPGEGQDVVRSTSLRSVMTLPQYTPAPKPTEQIIGREGERDGVDTVVDFPETVVEEEERREEEMESLYQIREARRREAARRGERRAALREARMTNDRTRIAQLREESRRSPRGSEGQDGRERAPSPDPSADPTPTSSQLISQHQAIMLTRERRIASVEYAEVGHVQHNGTRLRSTSTLGDSDSAPLLDHSRTNDTRSVSGTTDVGGRSFGDQSILTASSHTESFMSMALEQSQISGRGSPPRYVEMDLGEAPPYEPSAAAPRDGTEDAHGHQAAVNRAPESGNGETSIHRGASSSSSS